MALNTLITNEVTRFNWLSTELNLTNQGSIKDRRRIALISSNSTPDLSFNTEVTESQKKQIQVLRSFHSESFAITNLYVISSSDGSNKQIEPLLTINDPAYPDELYNYLGILQAVARINDRYHFLFNYGLTKWKLWSGIMFQTWIMKNKKQYQVFVDFDTKKGFERFQSPRVIFKNARGKIIKIAEFNSDYIRCQYDLSLEDKFQKLLESD